MSIHKSKGLEFPIVILADLNKSFNKIDLQTPVLVHPKLGLGPTYIDLDRRIRYPTIAREAVSQRLSREMRSEEMRVLYVGMTRAKEKLILTASMTSAPKKLAELTALAAFSAGDGGRREVHGRVGAAAPPAASGGRAPPCGGRGGGRAVPDL